MELQNLAPAGFCFFIYLCIMEYILEITPQTSPRPRVTKNGAYMPKEYVQYKTDLCWLIKDAKIPSANYTEIIATCYFPYPKGTPKKNLIEGAYHVKKPDWDNVGKGICDALKESGVIKDDNQLCDGYIKKRYTTNKTGRIVVELK